jgi:hypothetical protein
MPQASKGPGNGKNQEPVAATDDQVCALLERYRVEAAERGSHLLNVFGMGSPDTHKRV